MEVDGMSFHNETPVKSTRKERKCDGCFEKIPIDSEAMRGAGTFQGEFYSYIICIPCNDYLKNSDNFSEDGWCEGDIGEARREKTNEPK
jgi:hypothetical protein